MWAFVYVAPSAKAGAVNVGTSGVEARACSQRLRVEFVCAAY